MQRNLTRPDTPLELPGAEQGTRKYKLAPCVSRRTLLQLHGGKSNMGNYCSCGGRWSCLSPFKRKKEKQGTRVKQMSQQQQDGMKKGPEAAHMYDDILEFPVYATVNKPKNAKHDDSVHYADIQVFTRVRGRSLEEVKNLQMQNATEYATLNFPHPRLKYDSKNGTLV